MDYEEKTVKSEKIYDGRVISLRVDTVELPNKKYSRREVVEHGSSVVILPISDEGTVFLVEQFRKPVEKMMLELPAGLVEANEDPKEAAERELTEEIQKKAGKMDFIYDFYTSPGFTNEKISLYLARDLEDVEGKSDDDEFLNIVEISIEEFLSMFRNFQLEDSKTVLGAMFLEKYLGENEDD